MSPRTYIGPFGRILPLQDDSEPESLPRPPDEGPVVIPAGRAGLPLPQPELNFGSDTSLGFSDPTRYNTAPQRSQSHARHADTVFSEPLQSESNALPSLKLMLAPAVESQLNRPMVAADIPNDVGSSYQVHAGLTARGDPKRWHQISSSAVNPGQSQVAATDLQAHPDVNQLQNSYGGEHVAIPYADIKRNSPGDVVKHLNRLPIDQRYNGMSQNASDAHYETIRSEVHPTSADLSSLQGQTPMQDIPAQPWIDEDQALLGVPGQSTNLKEAKPMPRLVRGEFRSGEGAVWVYEDGSVCPKLVDGQNVNAEWGITKAGKPRKRLALACTACREKKIKCCPAEPKCEQCEKFGRECRYATASRYGRKHSDSPSHDMQARHQILKLEDADSASPKIMQLMEPPSRTRPADTQALENSSELSNRRERCDAPEKKRRTSSGGSRHRFLGEMEFKAEGEVSVLPKTCHDVKHYSTKAINAKGEDCLAKNVTIPVDHYLDIFFDHVGSQGAVPLPQTFAADLLAKAGDTNSGELMLLYAMLAVGTTFSDRETHEQDGKNFSDLACQALRGDVYSKLYMQQTRLLLALYHSTSGHMTQAWALAADDLYLALSPSIRDDEKKDVKGIG